MSGHSIAAFAWQLLGRRGEADANASGSFLSPISLYIALGMALNGAGPGSTTQQELYSLLHPPAPQQQQQQQGLNTSTAADTAGSSCCLMWPKPPADNDATPLQLQPVTDADVENLTAELSALNNSIMQQQQQLREQELQRWQDCMDQRAKEQQQQQQAGCWPLCCWPHGPSSVPDYGVKLVLASAVWSRRVPVHEQYAAQMKKMFQAEVHEVHNERPVNQWAARMTQGLIPIAVPRGYEFDLLLTNAVYFKGEPLPACC